MIPSTRICIAPACEAQSRLIQSIKELDFHKGHSSSSLGQITKKLKELFPDYSISSSIKQLIDQKCDILFQHVHNLQQQYLKEAQQFLLIEASTKFLNSEYQLLSDSGIDIVIKMLQSNINEEIEKMIPKYQQMQDEISKELDYYINLFTNPQPQPQPSIQKQAKPIKNLTVQFVQMPDDYKNYTSLEITSNSAKHIDKYPTFIMTNQLVKDGSSIKFKIDKIQEQYVGIALGAIEKTVIEKNGLILSSEYLQKKGHGTYLNFNDKCVYNSVIENGANEGKDKGIQYNTGDVVELVYQDELLKFKNYTSGNQYEMQVKSNELIFVVWLDLSEVSIV